MEVGKLYISKYDELIVQCTKDLNEEHFEGIVIEKGNATLYKYGDFENCWFKASFQEYIDLKTTNQVGGNHYKTKAIQPIDYILANELNFCEGNVVKYITRYKDKNGIEDLKKAKQYIDFLIKEYESKENI